MITVYDGEVVVELPTETIVVSEREFIDDSEPDSTVFEGGALAVLATGVDCVSERDATMAEDVDVVIGLPTEMLVVSEKEFVNESEPGSTVFEGDTLVVLATGVICVSERDAAMAEEDVVAETARELVAGSMVVSETLIGRLALVPEVLGVVIVTRVLLNTP